MSAATRQRSRLGGRTARTLPPGFTARDEAGVHESGWPWVIVGERDGGKMVLVPGGTFMMGSDRGEPATMDPPTSSDLSTYYIDQYEVTNRQFRTFLERDRLPWPAARQVADRREAPVAPRQRPRRSNVSYHDAEEYAIWASSGSRPRPSGRWPPARPTAGDIPGAISPSAGPAPGNSARSIPSMSFPEDVSPFGVFDMAGNAMEWVRDWYDPRYFHKLRGKTTDDPAGPPAKRQGIQRVVKGARRTGWSSTARGLIPIHGCPIWGSAARWPLRAVRRRRISSPIPASRILSPGRTRPAARQPAAPCHFDLRCDPRLSGKWQVGKNGGSHLFTCHLPLATCHYRWRGTIGCSARCSRDSRAAGCQPSRVRAFSVLYSR